MAKQAKKMKKIREVAKKVNIFQVAEKGQNIFLRWTQEIWLNFFCAEFCVVLHESVRKVGYFSIPLKLDILFCRIFKYK